MNIILNFHHIKLDGIQIYRMMVVVAVDNGG
jgi:hypothetical protein